MIGRSGIFGNVSAKAKLTWNWRTGAIGAASAVFLGFLFLFFPPGERLNVLARLSYDIPFALRPHIDVKDSAVWVIYMDEGSHSKLKQYPGKVWSHSLHEQLLRRLTKGGAAAVIFDVVFSPASETNRDDLALAKAMRENGRVLIAAETESIKTASGSEVLARVWPDEPFFTAAPNGFVDIPKDNDKGLRRHPCGYDPKYPVLALKAAELLSEKKFIDGAQVVKADPGRWINYYGQSGTVPGLRYMDALDINTIDDAFFTNKIFFIGEGRTLTAQGEGGDVHRTALTFSTGEDWPGVEIQATILLNLLRKDWITRIAPGTQFLLVLATGLLFGFGLTQTRPGIAGTVALMGSLAIATLAYLIWSSHQRLWFSWLIPCAIQIPCALGWAVFSNASKMYRENQRLQTALETATVSQHLPPPARGVAHQKPGLAGIGGSANSSGATIVDGERKIENAPLIPNYTLLRCVGRGAYGEVWLGRDLVSTLVAVKIIYRDRLPSEAPYEREFRGLQKFMPISRSHPGFVHILHVGRNENEGHFYYVMEAGDDEVSGQKIDPETYSARNLSNEIKRHKRFSPAECVAISLQLSAALEHLHQQQLIHRDIKPSNIIFVNNVPKFADIGLVTGIGMDVSSYGTPGYIAREGHGTPSGDVYSLGKVLYQLATGNELERFPELPMSLIEQDAELQFLQLNKIILKACEADQTLRFKSAAELRASLLGLSHPPAPPATPQELG